MEEKKKSGRKPKAEKIETSTPFDMDAFKKEMFAEMSRTLELEKQKIRDELEQEIRKEMANEVKVLEEEISSKKTSIKRIQEVDLNREVLVRSICEGTLGIKGLDGTMYFFEDYGDEHYMTIRDLKALLSSKPKFFRQPYIIVDDEEAIDVLRLKDQYDKMEGIDDVASLFNNHSEEEIIKKFNIISQYQRMTIIEKLIKMYKNGSFKTEINDGLEVVQLINRLFKIKITE